MIFLILSFMVVSFIIDIIVRSKTKKLKLHSGFTSAYSKAALFILKIKTDIKDEYQLKKLFKQNNYLIVSNHLSWIDILIISALVPSIFISSIKVKKTFFLGAMAKFGGTYFVERRTPTKIKQDIVALSHILKQGFNLVLFPEGTTGNGSTVLPFKNALFDSALLSESKIIPFCIKYRSINSNKVDIDNKNLAYWYGNMSFFPHFFKLIFKVKKINVSLHLLEKINLEDKKQSIGRKELAFKSYQQINSCFSN